MRSYGGLLIHVTVFGERAFQRSDKGTVRPVGLGPFKKRKKHQGYMQIREKAA